MVSETINNLIIGPPPPYGYQIISIKDLGANRYRVYLECPDTYSGGEPVIWWLVDQGQLKLYDWCQLDFGIRSTTENFALVDASDAEIARYNEYIDACHQYLDSYDLEHSAEKQQRLVEQALVKAENYAGPKVLHPSIQLLNARRWYLAANDERAITIADRIKTPHLVPGAYRLKADIHFDRGDYELAAKAYQQYADLIGPWPHSQQRLATIYREQEDADKERAALTKLTRHLTQDNQLQVLHLILLNDHAQNKALFARIDQSDLRESIYFYAINQLSDSVYFADQ